jgi:hypothetical protein
MRAITNRLRPWHGLLAIAVLGVGLAVWLIGSPGDDPKQIRDLIQRCALQFNASEWEKLSQNAWPVSDQPEVKRTFESRASLGIRVATPVELSPPSIAGDRAKTTASVEWTMAFGRIRDQTKIEIELIKSDGRWYVNSESMARWRP